MEKTVEKIRQEISETRLYNTVKEISNFHRIQCSPGIRKACELACEKLQADGIDAKVLRFTANENTWYLGQKMFKEWDCTDAWLDIVDWNERVCDFREENMSIIQRSYPCDYRNEDLDIVLVERLDDDYLQTLDLKGKLAFVSGMPRQMGNDIFTKYGAVGLIDDMIMEIDGVRTRHELLDTLTYISFWWKHTSEEPKPCGFGRAPRVGDRLRKLCRDMEEQWKQDSSKPRYPKARAYVDASLYDGQMEVVEAVVPGETSEEILMSAHICHPRACANDNASGCAGAMEALRVLKKLQDAGELSLKKTIRLILVPEMTGSFAYLSTLNDYRHIKGAINMDMIGARQGRSYGPITITGTHYALQSPVTSMAAYALSYAKKMQWNLEGEKVPTVNSMIAPYSGGSDHMIFSDTMIDIPCIMLGQWPDKYYHTSSDTLEVIDTNVLKFSTTFAASYVYTLSNFSDEMVTDFLLEHIRLMSEDLQRVKNAPRCMQQYVKEYYVNSLDRCKEFGVEITGLQKQAVSDAADAILPLLSPSEETKDFEGDEVYHRVLVGPINDITDYDVLYPDCVSQQEDYRKVAGNLGWRASEIYEVLLNYMDGKRTLKEIQEWMFKDRGMYEPEFVRVFVNLAEAYGLIAR
mgnify:CR=1 FL=1